MKITKGNIEYTAAERNDHWYVSARLGKLEIEYKVPYSVCGTFEDLKKYIEESDEFGG